MAKPQFQAAHPDLELVRQAIFNRLLGDAHPDPNQRWSQTNPDQGRGFDRYLEFVPDDRNARDVFDMCVIDVFWQLISEGVLAPGLNTSNRNLPFFHVTAYGRLVLATP